jgi:hypothetical protein
MTLEDEMRPPPWGGQSEGRPKHEGGGTSTKAAPERQRRSLVRISWRHLGLSNIGSGPKTVSGVRKPPLLDRSFGRNYSKLQRNGCNSLETLRRLSRSTRAKGTTPRCQKGPFEPERVQHLAAGLVERG